MQSPWVYYFYFGWIVTYCLTLGVAISILPAEPSVTAVEFHGKWVLLMGHLEVEEVAVEVVVVSEEVVSQVEEVVGEDSGVEAVPLTEEVVLIGSGMLCLYVIFCVLCLYV